MIADETIDPTNLGLPQDPVFIVGLPRSGTTLLQSLLTTQPGLKSLPETHFFNSIVPSVELAPSGNVPLYSLDDMLRKVTLHCSLELPERLRSRLEALAGDGELTPKTIFEVVVKAFVSADNTTPLNRWIEKTPRHYRVLEPIRRHYPQAQILCMVRHPVAVMLSQCSNFTEGRPMPWEVRCGNWNHAIEIAEATRDVSPQQVLILSYEDLVADAHSTIDAVCRFLRVPFDANRLGEFGERTAHLKLPHEKWKEQVASGQLKNTNSSRLDSVDSLTLMRIQRIAGRLMVKYGYEIRHLRCQRVFNFLVTIVPVFALRVSCWKVANLIRNAIRKK